MSILKELKRHSEVLKKIDEATSIKELPSVSLSNISSYIAKTVNFNGVTYGAKEYKPVLDTIIGYGSTGAPEVLDSFINVVSKLYENVSREEIIDMFKKVFGNSRIEYIIQEVGLKNIKMDKLNKQNNKSNHEEIIKKIGTAYTIKDLPKVGISELNQKILRGFNNNTLKQKYKVSDLYTFTDLYLNNNGIGLPDELILFLEKRQLSDEAKRKLFEEIIHNLANDETINYTVNEIKLKEARKLRIFELDHEETMDNIKEAKRISQLPPNLSISNITSYLSGNSTIYPNDNRIKTDNLKILTSLLLSGKNFESEEVKEEIKKITDTLYGDKEDAYELLLDKYKSLPRTFYLVDEVNFSMDKQKEFIKYHQSNVNIYFIPNEKNPIIGGKFFNVYINRVDQLDLGKILPLDLNKIVPPRMDIDSIEWYVQENFDPTFKLVGGIILYKDETIGNVNIFKPNDGKIGVSVEEKEKMNKISDLDKEIEEKQAKLDSINEEIKKKEQDSSELDDEINSKLNEFEKKTLELQKEMIEEFASLRKKYVKKMTLKSDK